MISGRLRTARDHARHSRVHNCGQSLPWLLWQSENFSETFGRFFENWELDSWQKRQILKTYIYIYGNILDTPTGLGARAPNAPSLDQCLASLRTILLQWTWAGCLCVLKIGMIHLGETIRMCWMYLIIGNYHDVTTLLQNVKLFSILSLYFARNSFVFICITALQLLHSQPTYYCKKP